MHQFFLQWDQDWGNAEATCERISITVRQTEDLFIHRAGGICEDCVVLLKFFKTTFSVFFFPSLNYHHRHLFSEKLDIWLRESDVIAVCEKHKLGFGLKGGGYLAKI